MKPSEETILRATPEEIREALTTLPAKETLARELLTAQTIREATVLAVFRQVNGLDKSAETPTVENIIETANQEIAATMIRFEEIPPQSKEQEERRWHPRSTKIIPNNKITSELQESYSRGQKARDESRSKSYRTVLNFLIERLGEGVELTSIEVELASLGQEDARGIIDRMNKGMLAGEGVKIHIRNGHVILGPSEGPIDLFVKNRKLPEESTYSYVEENLQRICGGNDHLKQLLSFILDEYDPYAKGAIYEYDDDDYDDEGSEDTPFSKQAIESFNQTHLAKHKLRIVIVDNEVLRIERLREIKVKKGGEKSPRLHSRPAPQTADKIVDPTGMTFVVDESAKKDKCGGHCGDQVEIVTRRNLYGLSLKRYLYYLKQYELKESSKTSCLVITVVGEQIYPIKLKHLRLLE